MSAKKSPNLFTLTKRFINQLEAQSGPPIYELSPEDARKFLINLQEKTHEVISANVKDELIKSDKYGEFNLRLVRPSNNHDTLPVILYIHGGGWVLGNRNTHDMLIRKLANLTRAMVVFPEYSLSPEAQYPKALNQIYFTLNYIYNNAKKLNINPEKIAIAGDSAGGNMAAAIAIKTKKENGPKLVFQALLYPVTDSGMDTPSYHEFKDGPWLTKKAMEWFWDSYLPEKDKRSEIYASPLKASLDDLKGLPSTLIVTVENDVLRDEGEEYAAKLSEAGVRMLNLRINGTIHDFMMLNALSKTPQAKGAIISTARILDEFFTME